MHAPNFPLQLRWAGRRWLVCFGSNVLGFAPNYRSAETLATRLQYPLSH